MYSIAIIGASGMVGTSLIKLLNKTDIDACYYLFGNKGIGKLHTIRHRQYPMLDINTITQYPLQYAMFMSTNEVAEQYIPLLASQGTICIDNSSQYRMQEGVPLVVTHINSDTIEQHNNIIANPNCTTIQLAMVLNALKPMGLRRIVCATYQAVSGGGRDALADWQNCANYGSLRTMPHPIYDNLIPQIDRFEADNITREEHKIINESRKLLNMPDLAITCMAVRVPISCGHGIFANIQLDSTFDIMDIHNILSKHSDIMVYDNPTQLIYPMPIVARNTPTVYVGRLHQDSSQPNTLNCFIVADNLLRGASYNALEILLYLLEERNGI